MLEKIAKNIKPILDDNKLYLYDIEYHKENDNNILRIYIDNDIGINLDDIAKITPLISDSLDILDPIEDEYLLEISSPGAEKPLNSKDHYHKAINEYINIELYESINNLNIIEGYLLEVNDNDIKIKYFDKGRKKEINVLFENIKQARLAIKF